LARYPQRVEKLRSLNTYAACHCRGG
jgi:hypothetical protein